MASQSKPSPELLEGSLRGVMHGINPGERTFLGRLLHLHNALLKCFHLKRWGVQGGLPCVPNVVAGRTPSEGSLAATLVLSVGGDNG